MRIWIGCGIVGAAVAVLLLPLEGGFAVAGLGLIGFGNGSIYPNLMHLTPHNFGKELSQNVMGSQIAFAYIGVMVAPPLVSLVSGTFGMSVYPVLIAVIAAVMAVALLVFARELKKQGKYHSEI